MDPIEYSVLAGTGYEGGLPTFGDFVLDVIRILIKHSPIRVITQRGINAWNGWNLDI